MRGLLLSMMMMAVSCLPPKATEIPFAFKESSEGVTLLESDHPVFFYQRQLKASAENNAYNNYLHPLYDLNGDTITEEYPVDHPYHRGIFWAWHQLYIRDKSVGDGWIMKDISLDVVDLKTLVNKDNAQINLHVLWRSRIFESGKPFMEEYTSIIVHKGKPDIRKIDFEITLKALVPGVEIGGSDDIKGYGGFCARIKLPKGLQFTSSDGSVVPQEGQVLAGAWMDFSHYDSTRQANSGLAILCHPSTPNYPAPWILRQSGSMQNIVFPGAEKIELSIDKPTILHYRLIIHKGDAGKADIEALQSEYEQQVVYK